MNKRRELIKLLGVSGGVATVEAWRKPVVQSTILPVHAKATGCSDISAVAIEDSESDLDNIEIIFDGEVCSTVNNDGSDNPDVILSMDASATGDDAGTWEVDGSGENWSIDFAGPDDDIESGPFTWTATRVGGGNEGQQCRGSMIVTVVQTGSNPDQYTMTASNISLVAI